MVRTIGGVLLASEPHLHAGALRLTALRRSVPQHRLRVQGRVGRDARDFVIGRTGSPRGVCRRARASGVSRVCCLKSSSPRSPRRGGFRPRQCHRRGCSALEKTHCRCLSSAIRLTRARHLVPHANLTLCRPRYVSDVGVSFCRVYL